MLIKNWSFAGKMKADKVLFFAVMSFLVLTLSCASDDEYDESNLVLYGKNVCHYKDSRPVLVNVSTTVNTLVKTYKKVKGGWWRSQDAYKPVYRMKSKVVFHMITKMKDFDVPFCCTGWTSTKNSRECLVPICGIPCMNGGQCVGPDQCKCPPGFQGTFCQEDVDECKNRSLNKCQHYCENTIGGFECRCRRGFITDTNDPNACQDIDECEIAGICRCPNGDQNCRATCLNLPGSYKCSCNEGYRLQLDGMCVDRNECIDDVCQHRCINTPGSYKCSCFLGFDLNTTTGECFDVDECKIDNGGCNQICHNVYGGSICSCKSGFYLDNDLLTCRKIDPTVKTLQICKSEESYDIISCHWPQQIKTLYAFYGRVSNDFCPVKNFTAGENCVIDGATKVVSSLCDDKTACYVDTPTITKGLKDTCKNTNKYLQIFYKCQ